MLNKDRHYTFLKIAHHIAEKTVELPRQFGAIIVMSNKVVAWGRNKRSHPQIPTIVSQITEKRYYGLHAEIGALLKCDMSIKGATVYVYGQNLCSGNVVYSKPCELCEWSLRQRGVAQAVFITATGYEVVDYTKTEHHNRISRYVGVAIPGGNCKGD